MLMMTDVTASPCEVREVGCEAYENITLQNPSADVSYSSLQKRSSRVTFDQVECVTRKNHTAEFRFELFSCVVI